MKNWVTLLIGVSATMSVFAQNHEFQSSFFPAETNKEFKNGVWGHDKDAFLCFGTVKDKTDGNQECLGQRITVKDFYETQMGRKVIGSTYALEDGKLGVKITWKK